MSQSADYLVELLKAYWFAPPVALWRAVELRAVDQLCRRWPRPLLDIGCGDGMIGEIFFRSTGGVDVGLDPWASQLRRAIASDAYDHIDQAEGRALPYRRNAFATVFSNSVLEHVRDVQPILSEVSRVLKPGGRLVFTVPSDAFRSMLDGYASRVAGGDVVGAEAYARRVDAVFEHRHYHTPEEWRHLLAASDLTLLETSYYMPEPAERFWDRMNVRYGVGRRRSLWNVLVSPRLRPLPYQRVLQSLVVKHLSQRWRCYYQMDVRPGEKGGGLLVVAAG